MGAGINWRKRLVNPISYGKSGGKRQIFTDREQSRFGMKTPQAA
jgi:hypothetical protein